MNSQTLVINLSRNLVAADVSPLLLNEVRADSRRLLRTGDGSWSQSGREGGWRLSMNRSAELQLRHVQRAKDTLIAPGLSPALQFRGS